MDAIELGELIRKILITGNTSSQRSADNTLNRYHRFDSKAVMDLIYYLQDEIDGVKEASEKPTREEIDKLNNAIQFYEKKLSSPWCSPYNKKTDGGYLDRLKRLKESWVKGE